MLEHPIFLLGMPRSGTTWLSQVFEAHPQVAVRLSPNFSFALKDRLDPDSDRAVWLEVLGEAAASTDPFLTQDWRRSRGELPVFEGKKASTHLVIKDTRYLETYRAGMEVLPAARCLVVVRHPCAVLHSWWKSAEFPDDADLLHEWRTGACRKPEDGGRGESWGFDDWCAQTRRFLDLEKEAPERYRVFRYEETVVAPEAALRALFDFAGIAWSEEVLEFVARSHGSHDGDPYSVFKDPRKVLDGWRGSLPEQVAEVVARELAGTELERFLEEV